MALFFYQFTPLYGHNLKPGSKRLNFYGQTAIFDHFVRNRLFSSRPFTDKFPIFIDVSVNESVFDKCRVRQISAHKLSVKFAASLFWDISIMEEIVMHTQKTGSGLQLNASHPVFQFEAWFFSRPLFIGDWI